MYLNPSAVVAVGRARHSQWIEQAEQDRLASQLRTMAKAARQVQRAEWSRLLANRTQQSSASQ